MARNDDTDNIKRLAESVSAPIGPEDVAINELVGQARKQGKDLPYPRDRLIETVAAITEGERVEDIEDAAEFIVRKHGSPVPVDPREDPEGAVSQLTEQIEQNEREIEALTEANQ